ncbi:integrase core domain-containing protein [Loktanella sp. DJP18]|uniref:integrase core domain-containing protein n=1 Tax=Loktanella sp. DJP18 TaxID=3409788 RepID=UPI003BB68C66
MSASAIPKLSGSTAAANSSPATAYANVLTLDVSRPGRPTGHGFIEAINSKLQSECLNAHWFISLADSKEKLETLRRHTNEDRPQSTIGYNIPKALDYTGGTISPSS